MHSGHLANKGDDTPPSRITYWLYWFLVREFEGKSRVLWNFTLLCVCVCIFMPCEDIVSCKDILGLCVWHFTCEDMDHKHMSGVCVHPSISLHVIARSWKKDGSSLQKQTNPSAAFTFFSPCMPLSQTILVCSTTELHPQCPASWPRRGTAGLLSSLIHMALLFVSVSGLLCAGVSQNSLVHSLFILLLCLPRFGLGVRKER